jgi:DNA invertase Pin-like site-specific DNA recombinase
MLIGYARISTAEQNLDLQIDNLKTAGCERIFSDCISGSKSDRPGLIDALNFARSTDVLVVWKLDRLGRSLSHLIETVQKLTERGIEFRSLQENLETVSPGGKLLFHIFGAIAEFERDLIRERTMAGLESARARGRKGGAKKLLSKAQIRAGKELAADRTRSVSDICELLRCSPSTYYRHIRKNQSS